MSRKRNKRPALANTPGGASNRNLQPGAATGQNSGSAWPPAGLPTRVVSAKDVDWRLPENVLLGDDGSVRYIDPAGALYPCALKTSSSGKVYIEFDAVQAGEPFKFWLARAFYTAFNGEIPADCEPFPIDGKHANLRPSNLALRRKEEPRSTYKPYEPPTGFRPNGGAPN